MDIRRNESDEKLKMKNLQFSKKESLIVQYFEHEIMYIDTNRLLILVFVSCASFLWTYHWHQW